MGQQGLGKGRLTGQVTDEEGKPIEGAKVVVRFLGTSDLAFEATTDKKGQWRLLGLGTGNWNVTASKDGYDSANRDCFIRQLTDNPRVPLVLARLKSGVRQPEAGLLEIANDYFYAKKYTEAAAAYREYLQKNPDDVMVRLSAGDCFRESGDYENAMAEYARVVSMTEKDPLSKAITSRGLTGLGECHFKLKDLEKAEFYFRSSLEMFPENEVVAYNLGEVCATLRKVEESIRAFEQATEVSPYWSDPFYKLGFAYASVARYDQAKAAFEKFLTLEPNGARAGRAKQAVEELKKIKK